MGRRCNIIIVAFIKAIQHFGRNRTDDRMRKLGPSKAGWVGKSNANNRLNPSPESPEVPAEHVNYTQLFHRNYALSESVNR